ncbi:MAG: trypsin-like peptidase domain-containing protein [Phycisphaerae bacterium]|nr:trypsin-like peptidase domain-containing protein [Phycisphaerae bacterium]
MKRKRKVAVLVVSVLFSVFSGVLKAQPANDLCANAAAVYLDQLYFGSTAGATGSAASSCSYKDRRDVWHVFKPAQTGLHTISLRGSAFDTTLSVYDGCGGTELGCNDDLDNLCSELVIALAAGQNYMIRIAGYDGDVGDYVLLVTERLIQPENDLCENAIEIVEFIPFEGTTIGATGFSISTCATGHDVYHAYDVWHSFTPLATDEYVISLCGSDFDTTLVVFDACGGTEIACNDDDCGRQSRLVLTLVQGQSYWIRVAGFDGDTGDYILSVLPHFAQPVNDLCAEATRVWLGTTHYGTTDGATGTATSGCGQNDRLDVWHSFTPAQSGWHTVSLKGSDFDTTLAVYTRCTGQAVACNNDLYDVQSELVLNMSAQQEYLVRVAGNKNTTGNYALTVTERFEQPANDLCANAMQVFVNEPYAGSTTDALGSEGSSCGYYFDPYDVWHRFTAPATADYLISLCGSDFDTTLSVFDACGGNEIVCNDDSCGDQSLLVAPLLAGQTYLIRAAGYDGDTGDYTLLVSDGVVRPANDDCADAIALVNNKPFAGSTIGATGSFECSCSTEDVYDVWHRFTPDVSGEYIVSLCGSNFDTTLAVFDFCEGTELACNDDFCGRQSELTLSLEQGWTYLIRAAGYRGAIGNYTIVVADAICEMPDTPAGPMPADGVRGVPLDAVLAWDDGPRMTHDASSTMSKGLYGVDGRMEEYQVANAGWLAVGDATAGTLAKGDLVDNGDGTFALPARTLAEKYLANTGTPLCADEPYCAQPAPMLCTAVLVAPDIVATTGHCIRTAAECANTAFVFGFVMRGADAPVTTVDQSQVYFGMEIIDRRQEAGSDWALIRLDRPVLDHAPLPIRREGKIGDHQEVFAAGYPLGLPRKYAGGASVQDNTGEFNFKANIDAFVGNSGSPVVNAQTLHVEGILYGGNADFVRDGGCDRTSVCPDEGCPGWEAVTRTTAFADLVPSWDVYLGTAVDSMTLLCADSPKPWQRVRLACSTTYYWQVVARNACGQTAGPIWSFTTQITGDLDRDCDVDMEDFAMLARRWLSADCSAANDWCLGADLNRQGRVDERDVRLLIDNWLEKVNP